MYVGTCLTFHVALNAFANTLFLLLPFTAQLKTMTTLHQDGKSKEIINCAAYSKGRRVADVELNNVHEVLKEPDQFVWIALYEPSEENLVRVQDEFGLH